ncbi:TetR/AcrR family transcriptional regulator [Demequina mangrovi]|uniref:Transcriptional regulator, TetR family n=1 Tax=Demequina mangrovi TaxID=1043493 RepID=A0A1H7AQ04_9MICO|nr:TetR/AcrR family transcriptional regulator [Demequina mangrovi]SEJ67036.1 transcriptional regulator, TetR family [Demequina mangrovi]
MSQQTGVDGPTGARLSLAPDAHAILTAALEEIRAHGYREGSLDRIAAAAGTSKDALRARYPDERVLLLETLQLRDDRCVDALSEGPDDGRALLQTFIDAARYGTETPGAVELFATLTTAAAAPSHPGHEYLRARYSWLRGLLVDALRELEEEGELRRSADPQEVATQALALLDGLQVQWLLDHDQVDVEGLLRGFLDRFLHRPLEPGRPIVLPAA